MTDASNPKIHKAISLIMLISLFSLSPVIAQSQDGRPVADAGSSRYAGPDPIVLDGTGSYDPDDSGSLSYEWRQIAGPNAIIIDANTATPTIAGSMIPGAGRDKTPKPGGFPQTEEIQECEFELVVSDGELKSLPDTVKVIIVPDFGQNFVRHVNPPFDSNLPTLIFFGGGDCVTGKYTWQPDENAIHNGTVNIIPFHDGYMSDKKSGADWHTYYECGDMIIVYLSSVAPDYKMPIQTVGVSTGGQPAVDVGIRLNATYRDARYAVNRVTLEDASTQCRGSQGYSESIAALIASSVDGEQCWLDNYVSAEADFYPNVLNVGFDTIDHVLAMNWYDGSLESPELSNFNNGIVAGGYWSVIGPGKNLQLASTPNVEAYKFMWYGDGLSGYMDFFDEANHPGKLPEPVTLIGPKSDAFVDANGAVLSCEKSENAVGYQLLFGPDPYRVMDYLLVSDTPSPPVGTISEFPFEQTWWTIRAYDSFGSTIHADPRCINAAVFSPPDSFPAEAQYSSGTGEPNDPYQIATARDLILLGEDPEDYDKNFILTADIDLDPNLPGRKVFDKAVIAPDMNDVEEGFQGTAFTGILDGNGHIISHLTIAGENYLGLFGKLEWGSIVSNLGLEAVEVDGNGNRIGGLVGHNFQGSIIDCQSNGMVNGTYHVGGLVGRTDRGSMATSYSTGAVRGESRVGGLVGLNINCSITRCYSNCSVSGDSYYIGGLVGMNEGNITKCYSSGKVSGELRVGGLVGWNEDSIASSFWDMETSGLSTSDGGIGKTTDEMQTAGTFLDAGWDFMGETTNGTEDIWWIPEGLDYPRLWWELIE